MDSSKLSKTQARQLRDALFPPFEESPWMVDAATRLGLKSSLRPPGRPRKADSELSLFDEIGGEKK
jgi:hypothetical protein